MKFIIDAQLSRKLSDFLIKKGFESIHTLGKKELWSQKILISSIDI